MSEFKTEGPELKKLVKIARSKPLGFAFCPPGKDEAFFCIHKRKKPKTLGKLLRKESGQTKVAYGMLAAEGKTLNLTCEKLVPGLSKKLKTFFRAQKLSVKVAVFDVDGKEVG